MAVTSTNNLRKGSYGSDVTELQRLLNSTGNGYNLAEDGSFGDKTLAAVKDYQQRNGLAVDGIVGTKTWGSLTSGQSASANNSAAAPAQNNTPTGFTYDSFKVSDATAQADALLQQHLNNAPGAYQSTWQDSLNDMIQQYIDRGPFSYDLNSDALYQQYKDQYMNQGKLAMMDTMGQAAALTGGYGNSYAQSVGQQAYQGYLQQLNDKVPEFYQQALNQYNSEGDAMLSKASLMAQMEDQAYGRYRDQVSDYYTELGRLSDDAKDKRNFDYGVYSDDRNLAHTDYWNTKQFDYQKERDRIADEQWQKTYDENVRQFKASQAAKNAAKGSGEPKYTTMTDAQMQEFAARFSEAKTEDEALQIGEMLMRQGFDPSDIAYLQSEFFKEKEAVPTLNEYLRNTLYPKLPGMS